MLHACEFHWKDGDSAVIVNVLLTSYLGAYS